MGLLVCLLVYAAGLTAELFWFVLVPKGPMVVLTDVGTVVSNKVNKHVAAVASFHLFGAPGAATQKVEDAPKEVQKTSLRLSLQGVFTAEQGGKSGAIVEEIGKSSDYYQVGDNLPGNAVLETVHSDRILLRRNGQLETLAFDEPAAAENNRIAKGAIPAKKQSRPVVETPEQFIEEASQRLSEDPDAALGSVGLAPAAEGGYVYQGNNPMLSGMNLQKGDIIRSVNGHDLGDIKKDKNLMKSLYEQGSLEVEVVRDGASFFINYPLK